MRIVLITMLSIMITGCTPPREIPIGRCTNQCMRELISEMSASDYNQFPAEVVRELRITCEKSTAGAKCYNHAGSIYFDYDREDQDAVTKR